MKDKETTTNDMTAEELEFAATNGMVKLPKVRKDGPYFDQVAGRFKIEKERAKLPLVKANLEEVFRSAHSQLKLKALDIQVKISEVRDNPISYNVNEVIELSSQLRKVNESVEDLKIEYTEYLGGNLE